jgi:hypothetical protein
VLSSGLAFGAVAALLAATLGSADAAPRYGYGYSYYFGDFAPRRSLAPRRHSGSPMPAPAAAAKKPNPERDGFAGIPKGGGGVLQIGISIASQHLTLYHDGVRVAQWPVSTGMPGHLTPTGVFSIIEKDRYHHSNLYGSAPMYYMQRITWSGVALHEGVLPGAPASHGCIRMPHEYAARLWPSTRLGVRVIVARNEVAPVEFSHPALFSPKPKPDGSHVAMEPATDHVDAPRIVLAQAALQSATDAAPSAIPAPPAVGPAPEEREEAAASGFDPSLVGEGARAAQAPAAFSQSATSNEPAPSTGAVGPTAGVELLRRSLDVPATAEGSTPTEAVPAASPTATAVQDDGEPAKPEPTLDPLKPALPGRPKLADQPAKRSGQVAVFVSRKEKKIFVRQGFIPLFEMPIAIDHPEQPLGTHVFTAMTFTDNGAGMQWNLVTVADDPHYVPEPRHARRRSQEASPRPVATKPPSSAAEALSRIQIPPEAVDRISEILVPGSSLVVSDEGLGRETGRMTEFIVLTH